MPDMTRELKLKWIQKSNIEEWDWLMDVVQRLFGLFRTGHLSGMGRS